MPKGTRVERCYDKLKGQGKGRAAAICQSSTNQSLATGKSLKKKKDTRSNWAKLTQR